MGASTETKGSASVEAWLESFDVTDWDLRMVSLSDIDKGASRANQARLEAIDPTLAERYTQSAKAGAVFPPLVLAEVGKRLIVVDGNHRHEGLIGAKRVEHLAYVIKVTEALRHVMSAAANTLNGQPPTDEERRFHALQLSAGGYTQPRIAAMTGLTLGSVSRILRADRARKRCNDQKAALKLDDNVLEELGRIKSGVVLTFAVQQAAARHISSKVAHNLASKVNGGHSEREQLALLDEFTDELDRDRLKPKAGKGSRFTDAHKASNAIGTLMSVNPAIVALQANGTGEELRLRVVKAIEVLEQIRAAL
jgi:hypothetical protein